MAGASSAAAASAKDAVEATKDDGSESPEVSSITLKLKSKDNQTYEVEKNVAMQINFVKGMLEDVTVQDGMEVPMGEVEGHILEKVVEYCNYLHNMEINYTTAAAADAWENKFVDVDKDTLFKMILASNFLDIQPLFDLTCKTVANMIKGKTPDQIREEFTIPE